jgi:hypothetical protein
VITISDAFQSQIIIDCGLQFMVDDYNLWLLLAIIIYGRWLQFIVMRRAKLWYQFEIPNYGRWLQFIMMRNHDWLHDYQ